MLTTLTDFKFSKWATPTLVSISYILWMIAAVIYALAFIVLGFSYATWAGILMIVLSPLFIFLGMMTVRVVHEFFLATIRNAQYTQFILEGQMDAKNPDPAVNSLDAIKNSTPFGEDASDLTPAQAVQGGTPAKGKATSPRTTMNHESK